MKQVKAHIAVSLDGHTATLDNELDWLIPISLSIGAGGRTKTSGLL